VWAIANNLLAGTNGSNARNQLTTVKNLTERVTDRVTSATEHVRDTFADSGSSDDSKELSTTPRPGDSPYTVSHATNRHRHGSANTDLADLVVSPRPLQSL
jgi:hypothetical protein